MEFAVYSDDYQADMGHHIFRSSKYVLLKEDLLKSGLLTEADILPARLATEAELLLVHTPEYLARLERLAEEPGARLAPDTPINREVLRAQRLATGGTIQACELASRNGVAFNLSGGFHHAFADRGEGFCVLNDVAVATRAALLYGYASRVAVVDSDLHQGNGTASLLANESSCFTFSLHEERNYPKEKPASDLDIGLPSWAGDSEYLDALASGLHQLAARFEPDLLLYVAGVDVFEEDELGGLHVTRQGLAERDKLVFELARQFGAGVALVLGGGYSPQLDTTVELHAETAQRALSLMKDRS